MNKQPEALRLAKMLEQNWEGQSNIDTEAAAELRRLHEVNTELLAALRELHNIANRAIANGDWMVDEDCDPDAYMMVENLIAKATGETQ
jgi:hypothetical protein